MKRKGEFREPVASKGQQIEPIYHQLWRTVTEEIQKNDDFIKSYRQRSAEKSLSTIRLKKKSIEDILSEKAPIVKEFSLQVKTLAAQTNKTNEYLERELPRLVADRNEVEDLMRYCSTLSDDLTRKASE
jgi:hypothetical protein